MVKIPLISIGYIIISKSCNFYNAGLFLLIIVNFWFIFVLNINTTTRSVTMKMKALSLAFLLASAFNMAAQTEATSTTEAGGLLQTLKDSPYYFNFIGDVQTDLGPKEELANVNFLYFGRALTDKDKLELETRVYHMDRPYRGGEVGYSGTDLQRLVFRYRRQLLTDEENGFNLSGILEHRFYLPARVKNRRNLNGLTGIGLSTVARSGNFSMPNAVYYYINDRKNKSTARTTKDHYYYFGLPRYSLSDNWSVGAMIEGYHNNATNSRVPGAQDSTELEVAPEVVYHFTPDVDLAVYVETFPLRSGDGRAFRTDWHKRSISLGTYLQATVF